MRAMAPTSKKPPANTAASNPRRKGLKRVLFSIEPGQAKALRLEAFKRAAARGSGKPDASELVREAIAEWLARQPRQR